MDRQPIPSGVLDTAQMQHFGTTRRQFQHFFVRDLLDVPSIFHDTRVRRENPIDIRVDLANIRVERRGHRDGGGVRTAPPERRDVLGVLRHSLEPRDDGDRPLVEAALSRPGVTSMIRARPCAEVVSTPACEPVYDRAS